MFKQVIFFLLMAFGAFDFRAAHSGLNRDGMEDLAKLLQPGIMSAQIQNTGVRK